MNHLDKIAERIADLHGSLKLRPTLETAERIGELLSEAKDQLPHGQWQQWLKSRVPHLSTRTARVYLQVFANIGKRQGTATMDLTIEAFLRVIRFAKVSASAQEREETRQAAIANADQADDNYRVHHADARKFHWPKEIDHCVTDPEWDDLDAYRWLATFAGQRLKPGGSLLVQCGTNFIPEVLDILRTTLTYRWQLNIVYKVPFPLKGLGLPISTSFRPVLVFTQGDWNKKGLTCVSDVVTVVYTEKKHHQWEQPLKPWRNWIERLTRPGELIADPFAGSGTTGVAAKQLGRRFLGTEIDPETAKVAQGRINSVLV